MPETTTQNTHQLRQRVREHYLCDEVDAVRALIERSNLTEAERKSISATACRFVVAVRDNSDPQIMESFLAEYGLSSEEGVALMCLAEALLRVPDNESVDALIHDKIVPADWGKHLGNSSSSLVNASTWALMLTGKLIDDDAEGIVGTLRAAVRRMGEPVVRSAVAQAIKELGNQFVLGETIESALANSAVSKKRGYTYSYDMLGEAAMTEADAKRYHLSYSKAISTLGVSARDKSVTDSPGISVKLSALYPRYEYSQRQSVMVELVARTRSLAMLAKSANMGFNIDAEEADRLDLSLDVIETVLGEPSLAGWDGFGIVVQAYSPRAHYVIDWLYDMAQRLDRRIMVRLVKGAYWDTEIKRSQVEGLEGFPVFTRKPHTDISYISCAGKLLEMTDRIYPQFATHNAHTIAAILHQSDDYDCYEFQRLHGMGEAVHQHVLKLHGTRCRIYAPVGAHEDLLAYLVRRLLENGANSSFVNQIVDESIPAEVIAADPFLEFKADASNVLIPVSADLYQPERKNSAGLDITDPLEMELLDTHRAKWKQHKWKAFPVVPNSRTSTTASALTIFNPADNRDETGSVTYATKEDVSLAFSNAESAFLNWRALSVVHRAAILKKTADLFEQNTAELISLACREAGKTILDGVAEIREAVDFLRYYAAQATQLMTEAHVQPCGTIVCISPWNFPLAIFTGQISAALATGNVVLAKPAEQTTLMAFRAVELFLEAGLPEGVLQLLPGRGNEIGSDLTTDKRTAGVCFTGSTATAQLINRNIAKHCFPGTPFIAETGGINAMVVDSTALPEQAIRDIVASSFQSAGQRCSALRVLLVQDEIADKMLTMLQGAMDLLQVGDPWNLSTDVGPVIDSAALALIKQHIEKPGANAKVIHQTPLPKTPPSGTFLCPTIIALDSLEDLQREVFGPVLHIVRFRANEFSKVLSAVNKTGYGLTFGLHTRVDERVQEAVDCIEAGNIYVNRNQIGAIVGSQPFGGKALSGTGPKAGGPHYLLKFLREDVGSSELGHSADSQTDPTDQPESATPLEVQEAIDALLQMTQTKLESDETGYIETMASRLDTLSESLCVEKKQCHRALEHARAHYHPTIDLPGPTGESNRLGMEAAGIFLCLDSGHNDSLARTRWFAQIIQCLSLGNRALVVSDSMDVTTAVTTLQTDFPVRLVAGSASSALPLELEHLDGVIATGTQGWLSEVRRSLSQREGPILPLVEGLFDISPLIAEKSLCIDTTAAGGNATLLAASA